MAKEYAGIKVLYECQALRLTLLREKKSNESVMYKVEIKRNNYPDLSVPQRVQHSILFSHCILDILRFSKTELVFLEIGN